MVEREEASRKERSDKKWEYPLRLDKQIEAEVKALALNVGKPIGQVLDRLITAALHNEEILNNIYAMWPPKDLFIMVRRRE
ncbi:hypothetical protein Dred_0992 [Desulforamulus reducens MI-1]|uniref:Uncharacterized protein n=1 Tax=Desulforamulus reducens (strain ATCC BAA-1160 / DSM 100696 / MI-1) TaxID=349161 RepID=A4J374_DESRM|nr:hypothetical protein [Desulforamulus reducens]ABO49527.1 hypothetical protein Dred_0992 [Desulforamulus reducens MI-1]